MKMPRFRHRRQLTIGLAAAALPFCGLSASELVTSEETAPVETQDGAMLVLEIQYRGLNLAPLFFNIPNGHYRVELHPLVASSSRQAAIVRRIDLTHDIPPAMFHMNGVPPGEYRLVLVEELTGGDRLIRDSAVTVKEQIS